MATGFDMTPFIQLMNGHREDAAFDLGSRKATTAAADLLTYGFSEVRSDASIEQVAKSIYGATESVLAWEDVEAEDASRIRDLARIAVDRVVALFNEALIARTHAKDEVQVEG